MALSGSTASINPVTRSKGNKQSNEAIERMNIVKKLLKPCKLAALGSQNGDFVVAL